MSERDLSGIWFTGELSGASHRSASHTCSDRDKQHWCDIALAARVISLII